MTVRPEIELINGIHGAELHAHLWPSGPEGGPAPDRYDVMIEHRSYVSMKQADGSYVIPDIPPGRYTLVSTAWSRVQYLGQGEESFDVSGSDVTVHVHLGGLGEIAGTVISLAQEVHEGKEYLAGSQTVSATCSASVGAVLGSSPKSD